ncbi:MAG: ABC transporter permease [Dongiaceae bacterium]
MTVNTGNRLARPAPVPKPDEPSFIGRVVKAVRYLSGSPTAMIGSFIVLFWVLVAILAPWLAPYDPNAIDYVALANPRPSEAYLLGTDHLGRDILSRLIWGARTVLIVAPLGILSALIVGSTMGMVAGYYGGWVDEVLSRFSDLVLAFPVLILYVLLITTLGASAVNIILAVTISSSPAIGRLVRGQVLELRTRDYVAAAKLRGESAAYIMLVEILPNTRGPIIIDACLRIGWTIIMIGVLGFLGLGLPPPTPDWGGMVKDAAKVIFSYPHMAIFPSVAISSLVVGFNLLADGLRELADRD